MSRSLPSACSLRLIPDLSLYVCKCALYIVAEQEEGSGAWDGCFIQRQTFVTSFLFCSARLATLCTVCSGETYLANEVTLHHLLRIVFNTV